MQLTPIKVYTDNKKATVFKVYAPNNLSSNT